MTVTSWPWGRAGQRLSDTEQRERRMYRRERFRSALVIEEQRIEREKRMWAGGLLKPYVITQWLDMRNLEGPTVDARCGAREPEVDMWEAGHLYPTWEQTVLLAKLLGVTIERLCSDTPVDLASGSSYRLHHPVDPQDDQPRVWRFAEDVVRRTVRTT